MPGWRRRCCRVAGRACPRSRRAGSAARGSSPSRPDSAALKLWMTSPIWPSPPALTTADSDDSVCSVDGIGRRLVQADGRTGCSRPLGGLPERRVQRQMHRSQQAGLPDAWRPRWRDDDVGLDRDLDVGVPVATVILPTLPTTTSSIMTGEFDSSVATFGDLDVIGDRVRARDPPHPGSGSEFRPWKAQPVIVRARHARRHNQCAFDAIRGRIMTAASLPQAAAALAAARQAPASAEAACPCNRRRGTRCDVGGPGIGARGNSAGDGVGGHFVVPVQARRHGGRPGAAVTGGRWHIADAGVGRDRWRRLGRIARPRTARRQLRIGVDESSGLGRRPQVGVDRERQVVEVEQSQCGAEVLRAELRRLGCGGVLRRRRSCRRRTRPGWRSWRARMRRSHAPASGSRCCGSWRTRSARRAGRSRAPAIVDQDLGDVGQAAGSARRSGSRLPATKRCTSPIATDRSDSAASRSDLLSSSTLVRLASRFWNMHDLLLAVAQRRDEDLQVLDDVDDVAAAVGEDPCRHRTAGPASAAASRRCRPARWRRCR